MRSRGSGLCRRLGSRRPQQSSGKAGPDGLGESARAASPLRWQHPLEMECLEESIPLLSPRGAAYTRHVCDCWWCRPGHCFRVYTKAVFDEQFADFSPPEVLRIALDSTLLQILSFGGDPRTFPFIEPPAAPALAAALSSLSEQGCLAGDQTNPEKAIVCTGLGLALSLLPVDVQIGKLLLLGSAFDTVREAILICAAGLSVQSPLSKRREGLSGSRGMKEDEEAAVERKREGFMSKHGDPFTLLHCFEDWITAKQEAGGGGKGGGGKGGGGGGGRRQRGGGGHETHKWCRRHGLQQVRPLPRTMRELAALPELEPEMCVGGATQNRLYEMAKLKQQFSELLEKNKLVSRAGKRAPAFSSRRTMPSLRARAEIKWPPMSS